MEEKEPLDQIEEVGRSIHVEDQGLQSSRKAQSGKGEAFRLGGFFAKKKAGGVCHHQELA